MTVDQGPVLLARGARRAYEELNEDDKRRVSIALRGLSEGVVREEDLSGYPPSRRPHVLGGRILWVSPLLGLIFITRQSRSHADSVEHLVLRFRRNAPAGYHFARGHLRRDSSGAARRATNIAVRIAGRQRGHLHAEWDDILSGSPEDGVIFSSRRQFRLALGFLLAALRMRMHDVVRPAWRPVDWLLRTSSRTNAFITAAVGAQAIYIVGGSGLTALMTEVWEPCGIAAASLFALARWLRRVRGIELATSQSARVDE
ncbi:hypothetical protein ACPCUF_34480 [Streptomyces griseoincarnatus]